MVHTGPLELAAVGVSIALFNQVSRIAIFPLVSVTTSFVAEEDTLGGASPQVEDNGCLEAGSPKDAETKEFLPQKGTNIQFISSDLVSVWSEVLLLYRKGNKIFSTLLIYTRYHFLASYRWKCS